MSADFPEPWCPTCGNRAQCAGEGHARFDYPACRRPILDVPPERAASWMAWVCRYHGLKDPRIEVVTDVIVDCLRRDGATYSEIFEPSFSCDEAGWRLLRFSYAFPGFRAAPEATIATLEALCAPFGATSASYLKRFARALGASCVAQPLFGLAIDTPSRWRLKLYVQFRDSHPTEALRLASEMIGCGDLSRVAAERPLHLMGLDLGDAGLTGAKLYFLHSRLTTDAVRQEIGPVPLLDPLARGGLSELCNVLRIHRVSGPAGRGLAAAAEVDFALAENGLLPSSLLGATGLELLSRGETPFDQLESAIPVALRRISVPVGDGSKINGYYVLTDSPSTAPARQ